MLIKNIVFLIEAHANCNYNEFCLPEERFGGKKLTDIWTDCQLGIQNAARSF